MPMKYKIGFTVDAETLFGMIAKFLPFEHLSVEEVVERHEPPPRLPKSVQSSKPIKRSSPGSGKTINVVDGMNGVIMRTLADGQPHRYADLMRAAEAAGFAKTGIGSKLTRLKELGHIERANKAGMWRIAAAP